MIIGGIAAGTLGEPRVTGDVDIDILLDRDDISNFLYGLKEAGFKFNNRKCITEAKNGAFQVFLGQFHVDFVIASTDLEKVAIRHSDKLDKNYLIRWAEKLSDEAHNLRIYNEVKRLLTLEGMKWRENYRE
ncbi:MAG: hypothetical protein QMD71_05515 [bacterium]|nr:hypothetical protein [bacterium]